jgi:hypothetical protein
MICSSNVFFINTPDKKLRLKLDPDPKKKKNYFGSTTLDKGLSLSRKWTGASRPPTCRPYLHSSSNLEVRGCCKTNFLTKTIQRHLKVFSSTNIKLQKDS